MKYSICFILLIFIAGIANSQNIPVIRDGNYFDKSGLKFTFSGNRITGIKNGAPQIGVYNGIYHITEENGIYYLNINWDDGSRNKYLMIAHEFNMNGVKNITYINLYNSNGHPFFKMGRIPNPETITHYPYTITEVLSASSFLTEGNTVYSTDNLDGRIGICWAVKGNGVGEKIIFNRNITDFCTFNVLFISTGFVSYDKPYLYRYNSRPKKIRVSYEGDNPRIIELADTPNLQLIGSGATAIWWSYSYEKDLWIEILEVYPGTRYADMCVNMLAWYFSQ
jgi:hypothetical protein